MSHSPKPVNIALHQVSNFLEIEFDDSSKAKLSTEYLRVFSPSAEVKGHSPGQEVLQSGKKSVKIDSIEPVGNYAIRLLFNDGHHTGIFTWDYLHELAVNHAENWADYLARLEKAGENRDT